MRRGRARYEWLRGQMEKTKYEVKRVAVFSAVKTFFLLGGFAGFFMGFMQWVLLRLIWSAGVNAPLQSGLFDLPEFADTLGGIVGAAGLILPFLGAMGGAVTGAVGALLLSAVYNTGARIWGGLELELSTTVQIAKPVLLAPARPGEVTPLPGGPSTPESSPSPAPMRDHNAPPDRPSAAMFE
jgi:hypothetical protein